MKAKILENHQQFSLNSFDTFTHLVLKPIAFLYQEHK